MKAKHLKKFLDGLSKEDLNKRVGFISKEFGLSGEIKKIKKSPHNLLWDGEDDPSQLKTRQAFLNDGFDLDEVDSLTVEFYKGDIIIEL